MTKKLSKADQAQLDNYLGCNYKRREVLLARYGYTTQEAYFEAMGYTPKYIRKNNKTNPIVTKTKVVAAAAVKKVVAKKTPATPKEQAVDMVIAFDTTGSMASYLTNVKSHVQTLIPELLFSNQNLALKIVAFGDYIDMKSTTEFGNAYQVLELTRDENKLIQFVKGAKSTDGGDQDEFYELVIRKINRETQWREGSKKAVLLIADYGPHKVGYTHHKLVGPNTIDWTKEALEAAKLGITYDTLTINSSIVWYKELSAITGGTSLPFSRSNKTKNLVEASTLSRSSKSGFEKKMAEATASGDKELIGVYKKLSSTL